MYDTVYYSYVWTERTYFLDYYLLNRMRQNQECKYQNKAAIDFLYNRYCGTKFLFSLSLFVVDV